MFSIIIFLALLIGGLWLYDRFFKGCGCKEGAKV